MFSEGAKAFIARWAAASASERANSQPFLCELCDTLEVARPEPTRETGYAFEYDVTEHHLDGSTTKGRIDLYKRAFFVLESKQFQAAKAAASQLELAAQEAGVIAKKKSSQPVRGTGAWDDAMVKARGQAERYVRALPANEPNPAFLLVVDVGHSIEVFADFTQAGRAYLPFPDPRTFRIRLEHLADEKVRERLRLVWTQPTALDPALQSADVTRRFRPTWRSWPSHWRRLLPPAAATGLRYCSRTSIFIGSLSINQNTLTRIPGGFQIGKLLPLRWLWKPGK